MSWSYMYTPDVMPRAYMTVTEILEKSAAKFSKHEAFVHRFTGGERESITCEELATKAKVIGRYLVGIGVKPGDKVALVGSNSINWIISEYGILFSGGISVHINVANRDASDLRDIFESANCCGIIFEKQNNVDLETCIEQLLREETMCSFVLGINKLSTGYKNIDEILNENTHLETHLPDTYPEDPAVIFSTSGSTGKPKLVLHNHISAAAMAIHNMFTENSAIYFSDRPFEWGGGNVFGLRLDRPVKRVFGDTKETAYQGSAKKLWKILQEEKCDGAMLLPYILFDLSKEIDNLVPFKLNVLMTGGQIVDKKYKWLIGRVCNRLGIIYGATECFRMTYFSIDEHTTMETGEVGQTEQGVELRITNGDNRPLRSGNVGDVQIRCVFGSSGYFNNAEENEKNWTSTGWYKTGDVGFINERGTLVLIGRQKELISKGTRKIIPTHYEEIIEKCPGINHVLAVGVPDERLGEEVCICYTTVDSSCTQEKVEKFCNEKFLDAEDTLDGLGEIPKYYLHFENFPVLTNGKPDKPTLKRIAKEKIGLDLS